MEIIVYNLIGSILYFRVDFLLAAPKISLILA